VTSEGADLRCEVCNRLTDHELHYSGRLLDSVRCTRCGTQIELSSRALITSYAMDLEQRLASKPRRMMRRISRDPASYLRQLPRAVLRQPPKFLREFRGLLRR
jgi:predicted transcriptional regulator